MPHFSGGACTRRGVGISCRKPYNFSPPYPAGHQRDISGTSNAVPLRASAYPPVGGSRLINSRAATGVGKMPQTPAMGGGLPMVAPVPPNP